MERRSSSSGNGRWSEAAEGRSTQCDGDDDDHRWLRGCDGGDDTATTVGCVDLKMLRDIQNLTSGSFPAFFSWVLMTYLSLGQQGGVEPNNPII